MKWEDLSKEEQKKWDDFANKHWDKIVLLKKIQDGGCFMCKYKQKTFSELGFHLHSTHGISPEIFQLIIREHLDEKKSH